MSGNPRSDRARSIGASPGGMQTPSAYWTIRDSLRGNPDADPTAACQRDTRAQHGCRPEGEFRPPGDAGGPCRPRPVAMGRLPAAQPRQPVVARLRPFRNLERPRLDASLLAAVPHRLTHAAPRGAEIPRTRPRTA